MKIEAVLGVLGRFCGSDAVGLKSSSRREPRGKHDVSRYTSSKTAMNPKNFNTPAHTLVHALDQWHSALTEQSNNLFAQPLHRQLVDFDPMHYFALLPQLQPPAGRRVSR